MCLCTICTIKHSPMLLLRITKNDIVHFCHLKKLTHFSVKSAGFNFSKMKCSLRKWGTCSLMMGNLAGRTVQRHLKKDIFNVAKVILMRQKNAMQESRSVFPNVGNMVHW